MDMRKLKGKIVEEDMTVEELADTIGISATTLYRKLRAPLKMTIGDAIKIKDVLGLTDEEALDIFLF